jgi:UDP-2,3-diacylglucosamine pyrophosphatase LpxH
LKIAYTENEHEMRVTWVVSPFDFGQEITYREILCGDTKDGEWQRSEPKGHYFLHGFMPYQYQYIYHAEIPGLRKECTYEYTIGNGIFWRESKFFSGRTPHYNQPFDREDLEYQPALLVIGDMGAGNYSQYTRQMMEAEAHAGSYDFSIHLGDISYNLEDMGGTVGNQFMDEIESFASEVPYMVVPGNHERPRNFTHYVNRFNMPRNWASQKTSFYYSFNYGRAHFVFYSTETIFFGTVDVHSRQMEWLKQDLELANKNREEVPWIITFAHKPFYCSIDYRYSASEKDVANNDDCYQQATETRAAYEDIFYKYKVDAIIAGHVHNYERNSAAYNNMPMPCEIDLPDKLHNCDAPIHITTGNAGNDKFFEPITQTPQDWFRSGATAETGYGKLYIVNQTHIFWEQLNSQRGKVVDGFWFSKNRIRYH